jgi:creatinine amidohydrolase
MNTSCYSVFEGTIADMTWQQVEEAAASKAILLVPAAVIEQHGPHLPLATDTYGAYLLCRQVEDHLSSLGIPACIAPPCYYGITATTAMFPGTINIRRGTFVALLTDLFGEHARWGFGRQFVMNHHGDPQHNDAIAEAVRTARSEGIDVVYAAGGFIGAAVESAYEGAFGTALPLPAAGLLLAAESDATRAYRENVTRSSLQVHAEERETSMIMKWFPGLLTEVVSVAGLEPMLPTPKEFNAAAKDGRWRELSPLGYIGDPSVASIENGELYALEAADIADAIAHRLAEQD